MNKRNPWHPHRGAVSLTFDDGTVNQLEKALPPLDERGLRGTFYLSPGGDDWRKRLAPWRQVAERGHEIGNHTLSHPCPSNVSGDPARSLEAMPLQQMENDIMSAQERLAKIAPSQKEWTFAYPCYATYVGRGKSRASYVPIIAKHFLAGRGWGEYGFANNPKAVDLSCVWGLAAERMSGFEMIGLVEELALKGLWVVLVFHEIDGSRLTVGSHDFRMLLDYLKRKEDEILTAPVVEIAGKILEFQRAPRKISGYGRA